jgi:hypothetical protein
MTREEYLAKLTAEANPRLLADLLAHGFEVVPCDESCDFRGCDGWRLAYSERAHAEARRRAGEDV